MISVGDLRKAMEGLKDDEPVKLAITDDPDNFINVEFTSVQKHAMGLTILATANVEQLTANGDDYDEMV